MKAMYRHGLGLAAAVSMLLGCDTPAEVLTTFERGALKTDDGNWVPFCGADSEALKSFVAQAKMGDTCTAEDGSGCGSMSSVVDLANCKGYEVDARSCRSGHVVAVDSFELVCGLSAPPDGGWSDCSTALANGKAGDSCSWEVGACSRSTEDPCCMEMAACGNLQPYTLERYRFCAPGCMAVTADPTLPKVTDCPSAFAAREGYAVPCDPDFVCQRELSESEMLGLSSGIS